MRRQQKTKVDFITEVHGCLLLAMDKDKVNADSSFKAERGKVSV
jgi:hypothetical protein